MEGFDHEATYDPEDDKIRITPGYRLDEDTYGTWKDAGFRWAPKQGVFYAIWTPKAEDLALAHCGEIGDEDTTLFDRAEQRADRFDGYQDNRRADSERAREAVSAIADNIPFGQPILVGHHSEKRARRDAKRIDDGMRKAVKMWDTADYWAGRAAGALHHAKYLQRPDVRARRIKKLEAERRRIVRSYTPKNPQEVIHQTRWNDDSQPREERERVPHVYCGASQGGCWTPVENLPKIEKGYKRYVDHIDMRLIWEKGMLTEQGAADLLDKPKRPKQPPLLNYRVPFIITENRYHRGEMNQYGVREMTRAEYANIYGDYKGTLLVKATDGSSVHRVRSAMVRAKDGGRGSCYIFLTDSKVHDIPEGCDNKEPEPEPESAILDEVESKKDVPARDCETVDMFEGVA